MASIPPLPAPPSDTSALVGQSVGPDSSSSQELIVTIRRSGDQHADVERLRLLRELLTEFKGTNTFKFHLLGDQQKGGSLELAFPNDRTHYCPELERELVSMLGPDCYQLR